MMSRPLPVGAGPADDGRVRRTVAPAALRRAGARRRRRAGAVAGAGRRLRRARVSRARRRSRCCARSSPIACCCPIRSRVTLGIALTALAISIVVGALVALLFVQSRWIEMSLFPYAVLLQVTPIVAIAPLIIIWVNDTRIALVLCAVVVAIFPIISNTTLGLRSVDPGLLNLFRMCRASRVADPAAAAHSERAAVFLRRAAHRERPRADRRGGRGIRRRHRRPRRRARLPDPARRHPAQHPAAVRRAGA